MHPYAYECKKAREVAHNVHKLLWLSQCVKDMQETVRSAVMLFASLTHLIILVINVGRFPCLGSGIWPLSSLLFLWMLPWALMEVNNIKLKTVMEKKKKQEAEKEAQ